MPSAHDVIYATLAWVDRHEGKLAEDAIDELVDLLVTMEMMLTMHGVQYEPVHE